MERNPGQCSQRNYDLIIVGGGIYGAMLAAQATTRQLRSLLIERDDFGMHTSFNSLRIIHGGLRYLQSCDLIRYFESVNERRWFLSEFPEFVRPMTCLMPLYGQGMKNNSTLRIALAINDALSITRNKDVPEHNWLPRGEVIDSQKTKLLFPSVAPSGLQGAALWHDAALADSQRLLIELLHWSADYGADLLNYVEAESLVTNSGQVSGLNAIDRVTGNRHVYNAPVVINATGPWTDETVTKLIGKSDHMFWPSLAWNLWMDQQALSDFALAVTPKRDGAPTYFLHPWKGRLLIGTGHAPWSGPPEGARPTQYQIQCMLDDINLAIPGISLNPDKILRVFAGLLPARKPGSVGLSYRPHFHEHIKTGRTRGLFSVYGVKFTTSRYVANSMLIKIFGKHRNYVSRYPRPPVRNGWRLLELDPDDKTAMDKALIGIQKLIANESVIHLNDLVFRRTDLWESPSLACSLAPTICGLFSWDKQRISLELDMLFRELGYTDGQPSVV